MSLFKRISATLSATTSDTVARFENHRAIGQVAIERAREGVAAARADERRHRQRTERLDQRRQQAQAAIDDWTRRARESADEAIALQCLQRRHDERERLAALDDAWHRHTADAERSAARLRALEHALESLIGRYDALASRETLARAQDAVARSGDTGLDQTFERWETRVDVAEMALAPNHGDDASQAGDAFESRFVDEEHRRCLADELQALRTETQTPA